MHGPVPSFIDSFLTKIEAREMLTADERAALRALPHRPVLYTGRTCVVEEGQRPTHCVLVTDGLVYRTKTARNGRRQILSFHVPGDMVDLQTLLLRVADHSIETARHAAIVLIPHDAVRRLAADRPAVGLALWFDTLVDASIQREMLLNVGRRDANRANRPSAVRTRHTAATDRARRCGGRDRSRAHAERAGGCAGRDADPHQPRAGPAARR